MKNKSLKEFGSRFWAFVLLDLGLWVVTLIGSVTVRKLLIGLLPGKEALISTWLCVFYLVLYYGVLAFVMAANPVSRALWLNATAGKRFSLKADLADFMKYDFVDELLCYLVVCLPVHLMLGYMGETGLILSQFFIGQSAVFAIFECGVWVAFVINMVIYGLFWIALVAVTHSVWNRARLRK